MANATTFAWVLLSEDPWGVGETPNMATRVHGAKVIPTISHFKDGDLVMFKFGA